MKITQIAPLYEAVPPRLSGGTERVLLRSILGVRGEGRSKEVHIERPLLPIGTESLSVRESACGRCVHQFWNSIE